MDAKEQVLRTELTDIQAKLTDPSVYSDSGYPKLAKRQAFLEDIVQLFDEKHSATGGRRGARVGRGYPPDQREVTHRY